MSIKTMNRVWEHSTVGGSELLILLSIADYAHDDGGGAWPSLKTLSRKSKLSARHVSRVILSLEEKGELGIQRRAGPHGTNIYTVLSGVQRDATIRRCYMCDSIESDVQIDEHHTIPGDDSSVVLLCAPCHTKIHSLQRREGDDKMSHVTGGIEYETFDGEDRTQQGHTIHDLDPFMIRQKEPASPDSPPSEEKDVDAIVEKYQRQLEKMRGRGLSEEEQDLLRTAIQTPLFDDVAETEAMFNKTEPAVPRTAEQVKAGVQRALEAFHDNGGQRAGVADPTQDLDPWMDRPVKEWCAFIRLPYDESKASRNHLFANDLKELVKDTDKTPDEVGAAIRKMTRSKSCGWMRTAGRPTHSGFAEVLLNVLYGQVLPEGDGGPSGPRQEAQQQVIQSALDAMFDPETGKRRELM